MRATGGLAWWAVVLVACGPSDHGPEWDPQRVPLLFTAAVEGNLDLYLQVDGGRTRLTSDPAADNYASFSPDGRRIAFQSQRDGNYDVFVMSADGHNVRNISRHQDHDGLPVWSPDGSRLAFFSSRGLQHPPKGPIPGHIWIADAAGSDPRQLTIEPMTSTYGPSSWSPDGRHLLFSRAGESGSDVWMIDAAGGGEERRLTSSPASEGNARFSPDGASIAFYVETDARSDVVVMDRDGADRRVVTSGPGRFYLYAWSPDGRWLSCTWLADDGRTLEARAIRIVDGRMVTMVAVDQAREASWLPVNRVRAPNPG